ncbi:MAG: hypothetical protein KDN22_01635 [Verrucomicrobiae bacterium]|nr:hypothetical protein [Verrucomicrobiae bacterium]
MNARIFLSIALLTTVSTHAQTLIVGDAPSSSGEAAILPLSLAGQSTITGLQFDIVYPTGHAKGGAAISTVEGTNHKAEAREVAPGRNRVVLFSPTNLPLPEEAILQIPLALPVGAPAGGPDVTVQNIQFVTTEGQLLRPSVQYGTIAQWRKAHFTAPELANAAIIGDDRDPDGDGLPNLGELAGGSDPKVHDGARAPQLSGILDAANRPYLTLRYHQAKNPTAVVVDAEVSSDLKTWTLANPAPAPTGNSDATSVELEARFEITGAQHFLRLKFLRAAAVNP